MAIPDFQTLMLPVLRRLAERRLKSRELVDAICDEFSLTEEERLQMNPSGKQATIFNRIHWALTYLNSARLITRVSRGVYEASERGHELLRQPPTRIDIPFLKQYDEFRALRPNDRYSETIDSATSAPVSQADSNSSGTPDERIFNAVADIEAELRERVLQRILECPPAFFEKLVLDLLLAMGYGDGHQAGEVRGRSGDGGIDGVIREDKLGLDLIYVQAKRYRTDNVIGPDKIREFSGALDFHGARKGVFITSSRFSQDAERFASQLQAKRIVLVDGPKLTLLMLQHGVGVRPKGDPIILREIDLNYFDPEEAV
jgi:restriction system protein